MPAPFSASSTLPMAALFVSEASRAVFASVLTPASICATSGGTDIDAAPLTEMVEGEDSSASTGVPDIPPISAATRQNTPLIPHSPLRDRDPGGTSCHVRMQPLHHLTVQLNCAARGIFRA